MATLQERYLKIKAKQAELKVQFPEGCCVMVSVASDTANTRGGCVVEVSTDNAARHLFEGSHRLASDEEIRAYRQQQAEQVKWIASADSAGAKSVVLIAETRSR